MPKTDKERQHTMHAEKRNKISLFTESAGESSALMIRWIPLDQAVENATVRKKENVLCTAVCKALDIHLNTAGKVRPSCASLSVCETLNRVAVMSTQS